MLDARAGPVDAPDSEWDEVAPDAVAPPGAPLFSKKPPPPLAAPAAGGRLVGPEGAPSKSHGATKAVVCGPRNPPAAVTVVPRRVLLGADCP